MTRIHESIKALALSRGFAHAFFLPPAVLSDWPNAAERAGVFASLTYNIPDAFPGVSAVLALVREYSPFPAAERVSAYYIESNAAYHAARALSEDIRALGIEAEHTSRIPARALLLRFDVGAMGKNGLLRLPGCGARIVLETIVLFGPSPCVYSVSTPPCPEGCRACVSACPMGAIGENGLVQRNCLRYLKLHGAHMNEAVLRAQSVFLGCEECMRACPFDPPAIPASEDITAAFELSRLIRGDVRPARLLYGKNFTGNGLLTAEAIIFAAKQGLFRAQIEDACSSPFERVHEVVQWACTQNLFETKT